MSTTLTPEFRLLCAACSPPAEDRRTVVGPVDQNLVLTLARRHRVEGLVWRHLRGREAEFASPLPTEWRALGQTIAQRSLRNAAETARLQGALVEAGVPNLVLKGSAVEMLAYGQLGLKHAWDIDLLVAPDLVDAAILRLETLGYRVTEPHDLTPAQFRTWVRLAKECELRHTDTGAVVELHWRLVDGPSILPGMDVNAPAQDISIGGGMVLRTFATAELYSYLCVHGAMHGWSRLKWLADLRGLLANKSPEGVEALHRQALKLGVGLCSAQALLLCERLLGLQLTPALAGELNADRRVAWLVDIALRSMAGSDVEIEQRPFATTRILLSQFALGGSLAHAWAEFRYRSTSLHDRVYFPLPRGLGFLYPVLRLPFWIWRRLVGLVARN